MPRRNRRPRRIYDPPRYEELLRYLQEQHAARLAYRRDFR